MSGPFLFVCVRRGCVNEAVPNTPLCPQHHKQEDEYQASMERALTSKTPKAKDHDVIKSPNHYKGRTGMEAKEVIWEFDLGFCLGNAFKYIVRAGKKNPATLREDLMKARENINMRLEELDAEEELKAALCVPVIGLTGETNVVPATDVKAVDWKHTKP